MLERNGFHHVIRLDVLFRSSGGSISSVDRSADEIALKWALLPLSEGWFPGNKSLYTARLHPGVIGP